MVKIEFFDIELWVTGWVFFEYSANYKLRFWTFLNVWENLIYFIWYDISILIFSNSYIWPSLFFERLIFLFFNLFRFFNFYCIWYFIMAFFALFTCIWKIFILLFLFMSFSMLIKNLLWLKCSGSFFWL